MRHAVVAAYAFVPWCCQAADLEEQRRRQAEAEEAERRRLEELAEQQRRLASAAEAARMARLDAVAALKRRLLAVSSAAESFDRVDVGALLAAVDAARAGLPHDGVADVEPEQLSTSTAAVVDCERLLEAAQQVQHSDVS